MNEAEAAAMAEMFATAVTRRKRQAPARVFTAAQRAAVHVFLSKNDAATSVNRVSLPVVHRFLTEKLELKMGQHAFHATVRAEFGRNSWGHK